MSALTNYGEGALYDHVFNIATFTPPGTWYLALFTTDPTDAMSGSEVVGNGYARQAITFGAHVGGVGSNNAIVTFPVATPGAWGTVGWWALMDAVSGGNGFIHGAFTTALSVPAGAQVAIAVGDIETTWL
jgi:hypothetical protein